MKSAVKFILTRGAVLYLALFGASLLIVDYKVIRERVIIRTLNHNMPGGFTHLIRLGEREPNTAADKEMFEQYERYYEKVVQFLPQLADAHGFLGISYYYLGKEKKAIASLEKAAVLNPYFFWFPYNLGVIYYKKGDHEKAVKYFEMARKKNPEMAMLIITKSIEYQRALTGVVNLGEIILPRLKAGYSECHRLLILSYLALKDYGKAIALANEAVSIGLNSQEMFYYYAGVASYHLEDYQKSIYFLQQAIEIDPDYAEAYYFLSLNLKAAGKDEMAAQVLAKAVTLQQQGHEKKPKEEEAYLRAI
ncbi:MAG TPA: tetratricopeptide repeat protein [Candidatus Omnitrophota bacterium]|nr:tetratricopeptide repeat protein [Candidatus Omnitrophota bacterium]